MKIILLGAPGSGKGTQGRALAEHLGVTHLSTGDVLRAHIAAGTDVGHEVQGYVERGELVPDELMLQLVGGAVADAARAGGYLLDGFPRTLAQAQRAYELALPQGITADAVVYLAVPDDVARERLRTRDEGRPDDGDPEVIDRRLRVFHELTEPLLAYYEERGILIPIDATPPPAAVTSAMLDAVASH